MIENKSNNKSALYMIIKRCEKITTVIILLTDEKIYISDLKTISHVF